MTGDPKKKVSLIVFSGDLDKLFAAFTIATGAAASGMEVVMFYTFWGTAALREEKGPDGTEPLRAPPRPDVRRGHPEGLAQPDELWGDRTLDVQENDESEERPFPRRTETNGDRSGCQAIRLPDEHVRHGDPQRIHDR